jgi:hypothetical protein
VRLSAAVDGAGAIADGRRALAAKKAGAESVSHARCAAFVGKACSTLTPSAGSPGKPCSWMPQESQVESSEHQDDSNIHCQPFPESVSEEQDIYSDDDGYHRQRVNYDSYLSAHFRPLAQS